MQEKQGQAVGNYENDVSEWSDEDGYEKEIDELDPDCWITKRATSILEIANQRLDSAYAEVLYDSPEEFLKRAKADEIRTVLPLVSEKERLARMRQVSEGFSMRLHNDEIQSLL